MASHTPATVSASAIAVQNLHSPPPRRVPARVIRRPPVADSDTYRDTSNLLPVDRDRRAEQHDHVA